MKLCATIRRLVRRSAGVTLVELLVALGIMTATSGLVASGIFEVLSVQRYWRDDSVATRGLRHAGSMFAGDALNAEEVNLVDGAVDAPGVVLSWVSDGGVTHRAEYLLSGTSLVRDFDGNQTTVASRVSDAGFSRAGRTLTLSLTVDSSGGQAESIQLQTLMRGVQ